MYNFIPYGFVSFGGSTPPEHHRREEKQKEKMTHASVFSGIGGPEIAAEMLGWDNLFHCEINPFGRAVLDYWFPNSKSYEDITKTDFTEWLGRVDVLTGGFPCQPFSYAGKRGGAEDDRYLWPHMLRTISECRPTWVVGENVAGITTMVEQCEVVEVGAQATLFGTEDTLYERRERFTIERILSDLEGLGYTVQPVLIPACAVGAPHRRDRIFIVGYSENAMCGRQLHRQHEEQGSERDVTDTNCARREERMPARQPANSPQAGTGMDNRTERFSNDGAATYSKSEQCAGLGNEQSQFGTKREVLFRGSGGKDYGGGARWQRFPTVSPVHRGNDGLPFNVDSISLPWVKWRPSNAKQPTATFSKWRTESLKAYGNAIVPQVMYEIFRAIEQVEQQKQQL